MPQGGVGGEGAQQRDAVPCDGRGAAVALVGGGVAAAQHGEGAVLAGGEGGLAATAAAAGRLGGRLTLLEVVLQELLSGRQDLLLTDTHRDRHTQGVGGEEQRSGDFHEPSTDEWLFHQISKYRLGENVDMNFGR